MPSALRTCQFPPVSTVLSADASRPGRSRGLAGRGTFSTAVPVSASASPLLLRATATTGSPRPVASSTGRAEGSAGTGTVERWPRRTAFRPQRTGHFRGPRRHSRPRAAGHTPQPHREAARHQRLAVAPPWSGGVQRRLRQPKSAPCGPGACPRRGSLAYLTVAAWRPIRLVASPSAIMKRTSRAPSLSQAARVSEL